MSLESQRFFVGNIRGAQGDSGGVYILGQYDTESELNTAHPTGVIGQAYMVGEDVFIWNALLNRWVNIGQLAMSPGISYGETDIEQLEQGEVPRTQTGWQAVRFRTRFFRIPTVILQLHGEHNHFVRIRNVSESGFEFDVMTVSSSPATANTSGMVIHYIAII